MFRSKVDALRYLETGDIRVCKCRPIKRDIDDLNLMIENTPVSCHFANEPLVPGKSLTVANQSGISCFQHNIDQSTGGRNFSKPEVSEDHKTNQSDISGDPSVLKVSRSNVLIYQRYSKLFKHVVVSVNVSDYFLNKNIGCGREKFF